MTQTLEKQRSYKALFILNTRGYDEPVENLQAEIVEAIKKLDATVSAQVGHGRIDFARVTERDHLGDTYFEVSFSGASSLPAAVQTAFRLERRVKRVMVNLA